MKCNKNFESKFLCMGRTAVPGCVTGIVRVIHDPDEVKEFQEGEIIVTRMTDPDSVPYIQKSKGVITDHGGILCHAAIICRELEKPCIVGTKEATKLLKTGDIVTICTETSKIFLDQEE